MELYTNSCRPLRRSRPRDRVCWGTEKLGELIGTLGTSSRKPENTHGAPRREQSTRKLETNPNLQLGRPSENAVSPSATKYKKNQRRYCQTGSSQRILQPSLAGLSSQTENIPLRMNERWRICRRCASRTSRRSGRPRGTLLEKDSRAEFIFQIMIQMKVYFLNGCNILRYS